MGQNRFASSPPSARYSLLRHSPRSGRHCLTTPSQSPVMPRSPLVEREQVSMMIGGRRAITLIEQARPLALRAYDQIPMKADDLLFQARFIAPYLAHQHVAFVGDYDSTSALLGLLGTRGTPLPATMLVLDFDERVLASVQALALRYGFADRLTVRRYNVFDPLPQDLLGQYDWFYTNPPYGSCNNGESARLFITRGCELTHGGGRGCIILPDDPRRRWAQQAMLATQQFLTEHYWLVREKFDEMHHYHLDDDRDLASSLLIAEHVPDAYGAHRRLPYAGRHVATTEIPQFYGRSVLPV